MKYLVFVSLLSSPWFVTAQESGNLYYNQTVPLANTLQANPQNEAITLTVRGLLNARTNSYVVTFNVTQVGDTAEKTDSLMNVRLNQFRHALPRKDSITITTDIVSFVPKYEIHIINKMFSKTYNEIPDGFELQKNVMVRYQRKTDLDAIVSAAAKAEIYDLVKVDYFLNDIKSQYDKLHLQCMEVMKGKLNAIEALGIKTDSRRVMAEDFNTILPQTRYGAYNAVARPSFNAVKKNTSMGKLSSADLSPAKYYDAVSYSTFDVVINPVVDQPTVQLTYQMSIRILIPAMESATKDIMLITPNGALQRIEGFYK